MKKLRIIHPILFSLFPLLSLYAHNVEQVPFINVIRPAAIVLGIVSILWFLLLRTIKDAHKAAIILSTFVFLFFSFQHILVPLHKSSGIVSVIGRFRVFIPLWLLLFCIVVLITLKTQKKLHGVNSFLNIFAASCTTIALANAAYGHWRYYQAVTLYDSTSRAPTDYSVAIGANQKPDIYYIILDMYGGLEPLKEYCHYDNTPFLKQLAKRGFYIADKSRANYPVTDLSLASSLNLTYLDKVAQQVGVHFNPWGEAGRGPVGRMIGQNEVARFLKQRGYNFVFLQTLNWVTNADVVITAGISTTEFEDLFLSTTPLVNLVRLQRSAYDQHRNRLLYAFDRLQTDVPRMQSPKFILAHILAPHSPFVFDENGQPIHANEPYAIPKNIQISKRDFVKGYVAQLKYVNTRMLSVIDNILSQSHRPPIIIVQGDHSFGQILDPEHMSADELRLRFPILNAYYFPDRKTRHLYPHITPVNTFRTVFNHYFGAKYPLLKDRSYYSGYNHPYNFIDVTDRVGPIEPKKHTKNPARLKGDE